MMRTIAAGLAAVLAIAATPVVAAPFCMGGGNEPGIRFGLGFQIGGDYTESEQASLDLMQLRRMGVDATRAERWNGCIRAFVRKENGHEAFEFYDPETFERVY
jgi:hypothetical protein